MEYCCCVNLGAAAVAKYIAVAGCCFGSKASPCFGGFVFRSFQKDPFDFVAAVAVAHGLCSPERLATWTELDLVLPVLLVWPSIVVL